MTSGTSERLRTAPERSVTAHNVSRPRRSMNAGLPTPSRRRREYLSNSTDKFSNSNNKFSTNGEVKSSGDFVQYFGDRVIDIGLKFDGVQLAKHRGLWLGIRETSAMRQRHRLQSRCLDCHSGLSTCSIRRQIRIHRQPSAKTFRSGDINRKLGEFHSASNDGVGNLETKPPVENSEETVKDIDLVTSDFQKEEEKVDELLKSKDAVTKSHDRTIEGTECNNENEKRERLDSVQNLGNEVLEEVAKPSPENPRPSYQERPRRPLTYSEITKNGRRERKVSKTSINTASSEAQLLMNELRNGSSGTETTATSSGVTKLTKTLEQLDLIDAEKEKNATMASLVSEDANRQLEEFRNSGNSKTARRYSNESFPNDTIPMSSRTMPELRGKQPKLDSQTLLKSFSRPTYLREKSFKTTPLGYDSRYSDYTQFCEMKHELSENPPSKTRAMANAKCRNWLNTKFLPSVLREGGDDDDSEFAFS